MMKKEWKLRAVLKVLSENLYYLVQWKQCEGDSEVEVRAREAGVLFPLTLFYFPKRVFFEAGLPFPAAEGCLTRRFTETFLTGLWHPFGN